MKHVLVSDGLHSDLTFMSAVRAETMQALVHRLLSTHPEVQKFSKERERLQILK